MYNELKIIVADGVYGEIVYSHLGVTVKVKATPENIAGLEEFIERFIFKTPSKKRDRRGKRSKTRRQQIRELVDAQSRDERDRALRFEQAISERE